MITQKAFKSSTIFSLSKIFCFAVGFLFFSSIVSAQEESAALNSDLSKFKTNFYSETYSSPFNFNPINFQRIQEEFKALQMTLPHSEISATPFVSFENYNDLTSTDLTLSAGLKLHIIGHLQGEVAIRREYLNDATSTRWNPRAGLIYGNFWSLPWENFFSDMYAESFYEVPEFMSPFWTFSGWAQVGYRYIEINHFTFDPLVLGVRDNQNANALLVGAEYQMLQIGPQCAYYFAQPEFSVSLKATKNWTSTQSATVVNGYWFLFSMGVQF